MTGFLEYKLFTPIAQQTGFKIDKLIISKKTIKFNNRYAIALMFSQILQKHDELVKIMSAKSNYHTKVFHFIEKIMERLKEPPLLAEYEDSSINLVEYSKELYSEAYQNKVFLRLAE
jgi:hypothetical protein